MRPSAANMLLGGSDLFTFYPIKACCVEKLLKKALFE
jgi:hypothetical protein